MTVGIFRHGAGKQGFALDAIAEGLRKIGVKATVFHQATRHKFETVVMWTVPSKKADPRYPIMEAAKENESVVVCVENGYVRRDKYHSIGIGGINGRADFRNEASPRTRWKKLGVTLAKTWKANKDGHVLICGQCANDRSLEGTDNAKWCREIAQKIPERHKIIYRPHPLRPSDVYFDGREVMVDSRPKIEHALKGAKMVATFSSNSAVDALIAGVPVYVESEHSVAHQMSIHLHGGSVPPREIVKQWAYGLAYTQWNIEEMKEGLPWLHLFGAQRFSGGESSGLQGVETPT